ncbi:MAG: four helix bundle protein [Clostridia bacterium]|nr:four helix bundle protein [Clostridia bacterium]
MKKDKLSVLSLDLAKQCVLLAKELLDKKERNFADQIKRSSTSVAANIAEAGHPQSRADMISKFEIALKEAFETGRWLQMIKDADLIDEASFEKTDSLCTKVRVILIASIRTLKSKE